MTDECDPEATAMDWAHYGLVVEEPDEPLVALRDNGGKPEMHYILFYPKFLKALAAVQSQGEVKYGYGNWMAGGKPNSEYYDAGLRHLLDHFDGEDYDKDGFRHIAAAIWNFMQIVELNSPDIPAIDPDFDQEAFVERWANSPKTPLREK
jgi:hypothetical protein